MMPRRPGPTLYHGAVRPGRAALLLSAAAGSLLPCACQGRCTRDVECPHDTACIEGRCERPDARVPRPDGAADAHDAEARPEDADTVPLPGVPVLVNTEIGLTGELLCDLDGDGLEDSAFSEAHPVLLAMLTNLFVENLATRSSVLVLDTHRIPDPATPHGPSFFGALVEGTDCDSDPEDNGSGREVFDAHTDEYDATTLMPTSARTLSVDHGLLQMGEPGPDAVLECFDGRWTWQKALLRGRISAGMAHLDDGVMCAYVRPSDLSREVVDPSRGVTALDVLVDPGPALGIPGLVGVQPDLDIDEDGLETFITDETGRVAYCLDGDGTIVATTGGAPCTESPEIRDGLSLTVRFEGISGRLIIPGSSGRGCPPPDGGP